MRTIILFMLIICLEVFSKNTYQFKNGMLYMNSKSYTTIKDVGGGEIKPMFGDYDQYIGMGYYMTPKLSKRLSDGSWVDVPVKEHSLLVWKEVFPDKSFVYQISFDDDYANTGFYKNLKRYFDEEEQYHIIVGDRNIEGTVNVPWIDDSLINNVTATRGSFSIFCITDKMMELIKFYQSFRFEMSTEEGTYRFDIDLQYLDLYLLEPMKMKSKLI